MNQYLQQTLGAEIVDLRLDHCQLVNVLSGRIENDISIAIAGERVVGIGSNYKAREVVDVGGKYVFPGLIDAHIHLESCKLKISEIEKLLVSCGTSAVITDPHEITNVAGLDGFAYQVESAKAAKGLDVFFTAPSCVPALEDSSIETYGATIHADKLRWLANEERVVALGEMMNVPGILMNNADVYAKIKAFQQQKLRIDGHAPLLSGTALNACVAAGIDSDHESTELKEAQEKLDRGMIIMIREGSCERNLEALWPLIQAHNTNRIMFASDDLDPVDMTERGHINHILARLVAHGISPIQALQMATCVPAQHFGLKGHGAICPGSLANIVVTKDLVNFTPESVYHRGKCVFLRDTGNKLEETNKTPHLRPCMQVSLPKQDQLRVPFIPGKRARLIELVPDQILTLATWFEPQKNEQGDIAPDPKADIAKVVVFERHRASSSMGIGFVRGFGLKYGAIGSSVAHDSHNIIVVGTNDEDILKTAHRIRELGGGQVALANGCFAELPLPIAGLMSDDTGEQVVAQEQALNAFMHEQNAVTIKRPMAALSFMSLPVIPHLRITDKGLIFVEPGAYPKIVPIFE